MSEIDVKYLASTNFGIGPIIDTNGVSVVTNLVSTAGYFYLKVPGSSAVVSVEDASVNFSHDIQGIYNMGYAFTNYGPHELYLSLDDNYMPWTKRINVLSTAVYNAKYGTGNLPTEVTALEIAADSARLLTDTILTRNTSAAASGGTGDGETRYSILGMARLTNNRVSVGANRAQVFNEAGDAVAYTISLQTNSEAVPIFVKD